MFYSSIVVRIGSALIGVALLSCTALLSSYWISHQSNHYAQAINLAGSLRMQSYKLAWQSGQTPVNHRAISQTLDQIKRTADHSSINRVANEDESVAQHYERIKGNWSILYPRLLARESAASNDLSALVANIDDLVSQIQKKSEQSSARMRLTQMVALILIFLFCVLAVYGLVTRIQRPLSKLTYAAQNIGDGDFNYRILPTTNDELGLLSKTFNKMSDALAEIHQKMESKIEQQTQALQRSNTALQFLYDTARSIIEDNSRTIAYDRIVTRLAQLIDVDDLELCLIRPSGDTPYLQVLPSHAPRPPCAATDCYRCIKGEERFIHQTQTHHYSFPLLYEKHHYGALVCKLHKGQQLQQWQKQLLHSVTDQLALSLSLRAQEDNARRLALVQERTVIARELHDSLAQSLSYLKIQVARLRRAMGHNDLPVLQEVSEELHQGLDSAYRQLRELLTTFRLKLENSGLAAALKNSIKQFEEQSNMEIEFNHQIESLCLSPNEEIHLLQIIREAGQNAVRHSQGTHLHIRLIRDHEKVLASVEDDGIGIPANPEKPNHYGLSIMQERTKGLNGEIHIKRREAGGTGVYFEFVPEYLRQWKARQQPCAPQL